MDIARTDRPVFITRRVALIAIAVSVLAAGAIATSAIKPRVPSVSRSAVWTARVTRGTMVRDVHATGVLAPMDVRWIPSQVAARVERVVVEPGTRVEAGSPLIELSSPEIEQSALDAQLAVEQAESELARAVVESENEVLGQQAASASANADAEEATRRLQVEENLAAEGLTSKLNVDIARTRATELSTRQRVETRRVSTSGRAASARVEMFRSRVRQLRTLATLRQRQREALTVRAGIAGIVQQVNVEPGHSVQPGTVMAKVASPNRLKAVLKVPETQAPEIQLDQKVVIDTRNGLVEGTVMRIDPAVLNGTVTVDIALPAELPKGARPDLTVDGRIELDRLQAVRFLARPLQVEANSETTVFRITPGGEAERVPVRVGRASASSIEILGGLEDGDEVIVSDISQWSGHERLRID